MQLGCFWLLVFYLALPELSFRSQLPFTKTVVVHPATAVKGIFVSQALAQGLRSQRSVLAQVAMGVRETIVSLTQRQDLPCQKGQVAVRLATGVKVTTVCLQGKVQHAMKTVATLLIWLCDARGEFRKIGFRFATNDLVFDPS